MYRTSNCPGVFPDVRASVSTSWPDDGLCDASSPELEPGDKYSRLKI